MAFAWLLVLVTLMTGSPKEREPKRVKSEKDQTETSQQGLEIPASSESGDSTDWKTLCDKDDDETEGSAVQEEQPVNSPVSEYTGERRTRSRDEHFTESLISPQSGYLVPLRFEEMTAPSRPSTTHEGESSQHTPSLSSLHHEQQQLSSKLTKVENDILKLSNGMDETVRELQSINEMVKKIFVAIGCPLSDESDSD